MGYWQTSSPGPHSCLAFITQSANSFTSAVLTVVRLPITNQGPCWAHQFGKVVTLELPLKAP